MRALKRAKSTLWSSSAESDARVLRADPDGEHVWIMYADGVIYKVSARSGVKAELQIQADFAIFAWDMVVSADGQRIAVCGDHNGGEIMLFNTSDGSVLRRWYDASVGEFTRVLFHPDGTRLLSGSNDHRIDVWDLSNGDHMLTLRGHDALITALAWNGDDLLSGAWDGKIIRW